MTKNMTVKEALELAIGLFNCECIINVGNGNNKAADRLRQAADVLQKGSVEVEKSENMTVQCGNCGKMYSCPLQYCGECMSGVSPDRIKPVKKTWTEHEEIRIVTVKSKPVFEKVKETK